jgi:predicted phage tail protein
MSLRTIRLYGHLGERFGRVFRLDVQSPAEAVRALCFLLPGFRHAVVDDPRGSCGYRVTAGMDRRDQDSLKLPCGETESIRIVPVLCGAGKNGVGQTILGIILVVVGVFTTWAGDYSGSVIGIGLSMIVGGVAQMLAKSPSMADAGAPERPENRPSYAFDGAINTYAQGNPVPVCYGRLIVGSQVISAGMSVEQI